MADDSIHAAPADGDEPGDHDRAEESPDDSGAAPLHHE